jgi:hypothetical protein
LLRLALAAADPCVEVCGPLPESAGPTVYAPVMMEVRTGRKRERKVASEILATAFATDPVIRWLLPTAGHDSRRFLALAAHIHGAPGCADPALEDARPRSAALWDPPGHSLSLRQGLLGFSRLLLAMGAGFRRGVMLERAFARARPPGQFWCLAQIGAPAPGRGVGSALLEHRLPMIEGPAYLESSNVRNVSLYQRRGGQVQAAGRCPARRGPGSWTVRRGRYRLFVAGVRGRRRVRGQDLSPPLFRGNAFRQDRLLTEPTCEPGL